MTTENSTRDGAQDELNPSFQAIQLHLSSLFVEHTQIPNAAPSQDDCLRYATEVIRLVRLDDGNAPVRLEEPVAEGFLAVASGGSRVVAATTVGMSSHAPEEVGGVSLRTRAVARTVERKGGILLSPFTGEIAPATDSLGREWSLHSHGDEYCLASQMGATMVVVHLETVWFFPNWGLALYVQNGLGEEAIRKEIANIIFRCINHRNALLAYLQKPERDRREIAVSDFWCPHMSHNLWNIQTGWANLFDLVEPNAISRIYNYRGQNFFGELAEIFPDLQIDQRKIDFVTNDEELFLRSLEDNVFLCTVKDEFFTKKFAGQLLQRARNCCSPEFLEAVDALRRDYFPLVVTTVRLDNRAWIEQTEGYVDLFKELHKDYSKIGLIIDGLSVDSAKGWTTGWMSMESELKVARSIREGLEGIVHTEFAVGRLFAESIVLCDAADCFIAPSGSGMALYKWISNMPGLAFSNKSVLDENSPHTWPLRVWHNPQFRSDVVPTEHLPPDVVEDGEAARDSISRCNFHLDWRTLYRFSTDFLRTVSRRA